MPSVFRGTTMETKKGRPKRPVGVSDLRVSDKEISRRLSERDGIDRKYITELGYEGLRTVILSQEDPTVKRGKFMSFSNQISSHLRFSALSLIDRNGDVLGYRTRRMYLYAHGYINKKRKGERK